MKVFMVQRAPTAFNVTCIGCQYHLAFFKSTRKINILNIVVDFVFFFYKTWVVNWLAHCKPPWHHEMTRLVFFSAYIRGAVDVALIVRVRPLNVSHITSAYFKFSCLKSFQNRSWPLAGQVKPNIDCRRRARMIALAVVVEFVVGHMLERRTGRMRAFQDFIVSQQPPVN